MSEQSATDAIGGELRVGDTVQHVENNQWGTGKVSDIISKARAYVDWEDGDWHGATPTNRLMKVRENH